MTKQNFLVITERNSWEGETWSFFFLDTKLNRESFNFAKKILKNDDSYSFKEQALSQTEITKLKNRQRTSYMDTYNFMEGEYNFEKYFKELPEDERENPFYKGKYDSAKVNVI